MAEIVKAKKGVKKGFFEVAVPLTAAKVHLYAGEISELVGRVVKLDLTRSLRGKSFELKLRVKKEGEQLVGEPISLELAGSYIRKMFRKGIDYVEDSFEAESRDAKIRVKPFLITRKRVSRAVRNSLRNTARKFLEGYIKTRDSKELFTEIMTNKLQKLLSLKLKKIYPLAMCELRVFEITGVLEKKVKKEEAVEVKEEGLAVNEEKKEKKVRKKKEEEKAE